MADPYLLQKAMQQLPAEIASKSTNVNELRRMARDHSHDPAVLRAVIRNPHTSDNVLQSLFSNPWSNYTVKQEVARALKKRETEKQVNELVKLLENTSVVSFKRKPRASAVSKRKPKPKSKNKRVDR